MKKPHIVKLGGIFALGALMAFGQIARADVEVSTTMSSGTISEFSPDAFVVRTETATEPTRYMITKETTFVDESGAPVDIRTVKLVGNPVQVTFVKEGPRVIARKIIVRKTVSSPTVIEKRESTTTTTTTGKEK
jgi:hypothetical protein